MDLKAICKTYVDMREAGFAYDHVDQILAKIPEEFEEVKEALEEGSHSHLVEELGDLIQATLVLCDFLGIKGDQALAAAHTKLLKRYEKYMNVVENRGFDLQNSTFEERLQLWKGIKAAE